MRKGRAAARHRHWGQWIVLDNHLRTLAVGSDPYPGVSPNSALDAVGRRLVLPRARDVLRSSRPVNRVVIDLGRGWTVHAVPVIAPTSDSVVAVLGCYVPESAVVPPAPLVGTWEWELSAPGPGAQVRAYWSCAQFLLHGQRQLPSAEAGGPAWEDRAEAWPPWLLEHVVESDRAQLRRQVADAVRAPADALLTGTYRVRTADGRQLRLRYAGRRDRSRGDALPWRWHGIGMQVDERRVSTTPSAAGQLFDAAFAVTSDPLCVIDPSYEQVYLTSRSFALLGVALGADGRLPSVCHPDDLDTLRAVLRQAAGRNERELVELPEPVQVRLAARHGGWRNLVLNGIGVWMGTEHHRHVLCRLELDHDKGGHQ